MGKKRNGYENLKEMFEREERTSYQFKEYTRETRIHNKEYVDVMKKLKEKDEEIQKQTQYKIKERRRKL